MKRAFLCCFSFCFLLSCSTNTIVKKDYWYQISIPKEWKVLASHTFQSNHPDPTLLKVVRMRDDAPLEKLAKSERSSLEKELADFSMEGEEFLKIQGRKAWKIVGTYKDDKTKLEKARIRLIIEAREYKYLVTVVSDVDNFQSRKKAIDAVLSSIRITIPDF